MLEKKISKAVNVLSKELNDDKGYYYAWQSNIAMAFYDECHRNKIKINKQKLHLISNTAARQFLNNLIKTRKEKKNEKN